MADMNHHHKRRRNRMAAIVLLLAVGVLLEILYLILRGCGTTYNPPIIMGVADEVTVYEGDDVMAAVLDGVTAVGDEDREGETFAVGAKIYDSDGEEADEYTPGTYTIIYSRED
ncbi:MAG: hypothetical protein LUH54_00395, partial [Firmicutes bacterium]|nr:hypothetical protein [Bacillota bacterium]